VNYNNPGVCAGEAQ